MEGDAIRGQRGPCASDRMGNSCNARCFSSNSPSPASRDPRSATYLAQRTAANGCAGRARAAASGWSGDAEFADWIFAGTIVCVLPLVQIC
jgi:hypothetical protein